MSWCTDDGSTPSHLLTMKISAHEAHKRRVVSPGDVNMALTSLHVKKDEELLLCADTQWKSKTGLCIWLKDFMLLHQQWSWQAKCACCLFHRKISPAGLPPESISICPLVMPFMQMIHWSSCKIPQHLQFIYNPSGFEINWEKCADIPEWVVLSEDVCLCSNITDTSMSNWLSSLSQQWGDEEHTITSTRIIVAGRGSSTHCRIQQWEWRKYQETKQKLHTTFFFYLLRTTWPRLQMSHALLHSWSVLLTPLIKWSALETPGHNLHQHFCQASVTWLGKMPRIYALFTACGTLTYQYTTAINCSLDGCVCFSHQGEKGYCTHARDPRSHAGLHFTRIWKAVRKQFSSHHRWKKFQRQCLLIWFLYTWILLQGPDLR